MITSFKKSFNIEDEIYVECLFNRIHTARGIRYHVSVVSKLNEFFHFIMAEKNNSWKIINSPHEPGWVILLEDQLSNEIIAQL